VLRGLTRIAFFKGSLAGAALLTAALCLGLGSEAEAQPVITGVNPATVTYDITPNSSVTISGSGFQLGATITVGSLAGATVTGTTATAATPFVFVSASTLRFYWDNASLSPGAYDVVVTNPTGDTTTAVGGFTVLAPQPTVSSATPSAVTYGITPSQTITISGSNFVVGARITVGGLTGTTVIGTVASATTPYVFVASTRLSMWWPNTGLAPGAYAVTVANPAAAGGLADSLTAGLTVAAPQPAVTTVTLGSVTYGVTPSQSVTISGSNFLLGARVTVGGLTGTTVAGSVATAAVPYVFVSSSTIRFWWPNTGLATGPTPVAYTVTVTNPAAAGGLAGSLAAGFTVAPPQPTLVSATPNALTYGGASLAITVNGSGFVEGATITLSSPTTATTLSGPTVAGSLATATTPYVFVSANRLSVYWPSTSLAPGSYSIGVTNPAGAGGLSVQTADLVTIAGSQPVVSTVTPNQVTYGTQASLAITISGSGFLNGATIAVSGPSPSTAVQLSGTTQAGSVATASVPYVFVSATRLSFYWTNTSLPLGRYTLTVTNPAASGGLVSAPLVDGFEVVAPQPVVSGTSPNQVTYDITPSRAITITGANFVDGAVITVGTPSASGVCALPTCASGTTVTGTTATASTPFVFVRSSQLSFYWAELAWLPGRSYDVRVVNPAVAGSLGHTLAGAFTVVAPQPQITSITPSSGEYNVTLSTSVRIVGSNFYAPSGTDVLSVTVGSLPYTCSVGTAPATATTECVYIDSRNIEFYWTNIHDNPRVLPPGDHAVRVTNPVYAGAASSNAVTFRVNAPEPRIETVRPLAVAAGISASRAIDVVGVDDADNYVGFLAGASLRVEDSVNPSQSLNCTAQAVSGVTVPTTATPCIYVGPGLLRFYWDTDRSVDPVSPLLGPGSYSVQVTNPANRGGLPAPTPGAFRVVAAPELISVEPAAGVGAGARSAVLTLATAGFPAGSTVRIGTAEPDPSDATAPPYVQVQDPQVTMRSAFRAFAAGDGGTVVIDVADDPTQTTNRLLAVTITSPDGRYRFTCPAPSGTGACASGLIIAPAPTITAITPALAVGASGRTVTITGSRFVAGGTSVTLPSGISGTCSATSAAAIDCTAVAVASAVTPGSLSVIVINPDGGRATGTLTINQPPVISSLTPGTGAAGSTVRVQITGSGFQTGLALASEAGVTINVVSVASGTVVADFALAAGAADGYRSVTLTNPDGGSTAAAQAFYIGTPPADAESILSTFGQRGQSAIQYARSVGSGWSGRFSGPALSAPPVWQVMKASPLRDERLLAVVDDQRGLTLHVWNGQAWGGALAATGSTGLTRPTQTVDVAFEQQSGRGVAVYAINDTTLRYRVWDGTSWSAEALVEDPVNGQPTSGRPLWVRLEARPGTNDLILAYEDVNDNVAAFVWDGTTHTWGDAIVLTTTAPGHESALVDVAFERLTGRGLVAWATAGDPAGRPRYRVWNGGWGAEGIAQLGAGAAANTLTALRVVGDHASDRVAMASSDGTVMVAQMWDGQQWIATGSNGPVSVTLELAVEGRGRPFDLAWEGSSGDLVIAYAPRSVSGGMSRSWSSAGGWTGPVALPAPTPETVITTTTASSVGVSDAGLVLVATAALPDAGLIQIDTELIRYSSKTTNTAGTLSTLTGVTRGFGGTVATAHAAGAAVQFVPFPAWFDLAAARGTNGLALATLDTQGRVTLRRWTGAAWAAPVEAQSQAAGLVSVFDPALARNALVVGRGVAVTLAQHLAGPGPVISPPGTVADTTAPSTPTFGGGTPAATTVSLSWTAVGDDGMTGGMVARYELRKSFGTLSAVQTVTPAAAPGATEQTTVSGLSGSTAYTFELRAIDDAGNASAWSSPLSVTTLLDQPPPAVTVSLAATPATNAITVRWTVPVDDSGPLPGYQVRYSTATPFDFDTATPYTLHPPTIGGSTATIAIQGLLPNTSYQIAVKAVDAVGQVGARSNVLAATTAAGSSSDVTPPAAVTDLVVFAGATTNNSLLLQWTATGDPLGGGTVGRASAYEVRYATVPLTAGNFSQGALVASIPPDIPGSAQELLIGSLASNTTYYVALVVVDDSGNRSALSNVVTAHTALRRGYTIVSVPLLLASPNNYPDAVFGDDVGLPPYAFHWNSSGATVADGCYAGTVSQPSFPTCASLSTVEAGLSYFLYSSGNRAVLDATGTAVTAATVDVSLALGFNMVGNPYGQDIALSAVRVKRAADPLVELSFADAVASGWVAGAMYVYDGAVHQALTPADPEAVFRPWNGAWIQSRVADAILVFPQP
jgi:hypothetical protein